RSPWLTPLFALIDASHPQLCTLSLHDALPIFDFVPHVESRSTSIVAFFPTEVNLGIQTVELIGIGGIANHRARGQGHTKRLNQRDRKSTRLNSSYVKISYAVFCLKKKKRLRRP